jgi:F-type H+-transporting ATPase subunit b
MADAATAAAAAEQGSGGLPQFDIGQWPGQMVWMVIIFAVLLVVFTRVIVPKVGGAMAEREDKIGGDIGAARRLRDEAEAQAKAAALELGQARARAQKVALDAKAAATAESSARQAAEEARLAQVLATARAEAMGQVRAIASETAQAIVQRLTGEDAGAAEVERALASVS